MVRDYLHGTLSGTLVRGLSAYAIAVANGFEGTEQEWLESLKDRTGFRISSLTDTALACGTVVEAVGIPVYVSDTSAYSAYGITETGWYVFARIAAEGNVKVTAGTSVTGAAGYIAETGADHVDVAVLFGVAAESQKVVISWDSSHAETFVFKATDLAVRNLDYRSTFYVYDIADFIPWRRSSRTSTLL